MLLILTGELEGKGEGERDGVEVEKGGHRGRGGNTLREAGGGVVASCQRKWEARKEGWRRIRGHI